MKISISRNELKEAVAGFTKIVNGKSHALPILGCVRFESTVLALKCGNTSSGGP